MALKLSLKPGEKFVINGAVVVNGDRRTTLVIQNKVSLLRQKDILLPQNVDTPVKRIYFPIMMLYLDSPGGKGYADEFSQRMAEFMNAITNSDALKDCIKIIEAVNSKEYYRALMICKKLLPFEQERLGYVAASV